MANNVIMFYSGFNGANLENVSADLCVYSNTIINCTVSLTSTLDYSTFAPYDSVECTLLNRASVQSTGEYNYNYYSFMRVGTNPVLTNMGANGTNATAIPVGPIFYISEVADIGGGMQKIKGVSALALLDTQHYAGGYWSSSNKGNAVNEMFNLMQNWHQQFTNSNSIFSEGLSGANVNDMVGLLNANTNRNAIGQIAVAYGWHITYNRNTMSNSTLWISTNPSNFCTYTVPLNRIYVGNNLTDRAQSAGYQVNVTGHNYDATSGCINTIVLNNTLSSTTDNCFNFTCTPILIETLEALIGYAVIHYFVTYRDSGAHFSANLRKVNRWQPLYSCFALEEVSGFSRTPPSVLIDPDKVKYLATIRTNNDTIDGYDMTQYFSSVSPCEITLTNLNNFPFPWEGNLNDYAWWEAGSCTCVNSAPDSVTVTKDDGGNLSKQLVLRSSTLNTRVTYMAVSGGGGLTVTNYNISDIGVITANTIGQYATNVLARVSNFAAAGSTEKLSFLWNGARPGDILNIASTRNGLITDMTVTLGNIPKATANVRIGYNGR